MNNTTNINWENKLLLLVEDVETNKVFLAAALRKTKIKILWAQNGKEAVEMAKNNDVDIILMDLQLPIMDGYTAAEEIRKTDKVTPIIAQTAHVMFGEKDRCVKIGFNDFLSKPIRVNILIDTIAKYIN